MDLEPRAINRAGAWFESLGARAAHALFDADELDVLARLYLRSHATTSSAELLARALRLLLAAPVSVRKFSAVARELPRGDRAGRAGEPGGGRIGVDLFVGGVWVQANDGLRFEVGPLGCPALERLTRANWIERSAVGWAATEKLRCVAELLAPVWIQCAWQVTVEAPSSVTPGLRIGAARVGAAQVAAAQAAERASSPAGAAL